MEGGTTEVVAAATFFAIVVTKVVDLLRNALEPNPDPEGSKFPKVVWNILALGLGVGVAMLWNINLLDNYSETAPQGWAGQLLTGLGIGGVSSGYHELFDFFSGSAKRAKFGGVAPEGAAVGEDELAARMPPADDWRITEDWAAEGDWTEDEWTPEDAESAQPLETPRGRPIEG